MSRKFRNLHRNSAPGTSSSSAKLVSVDLAVVPVPTEQDEDEIAYQRNVESLQQEYTKQTPNHNRVFQLLKLTHKTRRRHIETSSLHCTLLKEQYPYFGSKKWVSVYTCTCVYCVLFS